MRLLSLIISLSIVAWLAYIMIDRAVSPDESTGIKEGDTIIDTVDYAKDAVSAAELSACLRLCGIEDLGQVENCELKCNKKYQ